MKTTKMREEREKREERVSFIPLCCLAQIYFEINLNKINLNK